MRSSVGLLETRPSTFTAEFLWFAAPGVGHKEGLVVLEEEGLHFALLRLVTELLLKGDQTFADSLTDGHYLGSGTATTDTDANVQLCELVSAKKQNRLINLHAHGRGFQKLAYNMPIGQ